MRLATALATLRAKVTRAVYTAAVTDGERVLLRDLAIELDESLHALPYPEYRRRLHPMLTELVAFHRDALPDLTVHPADRTIDLLAPDASPTAADIAAVNDGWDLVFDESRDSDLRPWDDNANCLCFVLRHADLELTSSPHLMSIWLNSPVVGYQLRSATPPKGSTDRSETTVPGTR